MGREKKRETHGITDFASETLQNWNQSVAVVRKKTGQKRLRSRVLQISDHCLALFGYTRKEFEEKFQQDYRRLVHPEDRQAFYSSVEDQTAAVGFFYVRYRILTRRRGEAYCMKYGTRNDKGELVCTLINITDEINECQEAKKAGTRLKALIRRIAGGVLIVGFNKKKFTFIDTSDNYFRIFGYTRE